MRQAHWLAVPVFILVVGLAQADVVSGPPKGEKAPALKVYAVVGMVEDKEVDYVAERKDKPTIYIFVKSKEGGIPEGGRPAGRYLKVLDQRVKDIGSDAYIVCVWLTENPDNTKNYLPKIQTSLKFEATGLSFFQGDKAGPKDWGVNEDAHITTVVVNKGKVAATFGYNSLNETDVPAVEEAVKKAINDK